MAKVVDLVEESAFTFRMPDETITIKAADERNAKQQKRAVGEVLKNAGSELSAIGQFDMGELLESLGKQFVGRGGGRKATTTTAATITSEDAVSAGDTDNTVDPEDVDTIEELAGTGAVIESTELEDTGFEEVV